VLKVAVQLRIFGRILLGQSFTQTLSSPTGIALHILGFLLANRLARLNRSVVKLVERILNR
jgi:hypothetical protein